MKKTKLTTISSLVIIIYYLLSFIFLHNNPIRVAKHYSFWNGYYTSSHFKKDPEVEYESDDKKTVHIRLSYEDNSILGMRLHKIDSGLWFIIPNSVYDY